MLEEPQYIEDEINIPFDFIRHVFEDLRKEANTNSPLGIFEYLKEKKRELQGNTYTNPTYVPQLMKKFYKLQKKGWKFYPSLSETTIRNYINGITIIGSGTAKELKQWPPTYPIMDFICTVVYEESLSSRIFKAYLKKYQYNTTFPVKLPPYAKSEFELLAGKKEEESKNENLSEISLTAIEEKTQDWASTYSKGIRQQQNTSFDVSHQYELITPDYFKTIKQFEKDVTKLETNYYVNFNSTRPIIREIIAKDLHVRYSERFKLISDCNEQILNIEQIAKLPAYGDPILVKIIGVMGSGKTTVLWHLLRELTAYCNCVYVRETYGELVSDLKRENRLNAALPLALFIDEFVSTNLTENFKEETIRLGEALADYALDRRLLIVISERENRYTLHVPETFENLFNSSFQLEYLNPHINERVFNKLIDLLSSQSSQTLFYRNSCWSIFNELDTESISDRIVNLLISLDKELPYKQYDWDDWENACTGKYEVFKELFRVVAFFGQFGVEVPVNYIFDLIGKPESCAHIDLLGELYDLLEILKKTNSPIEVNAEKKRMRLRNEKVAAWYFNKKGTGWAESFFTDKFLKSIQTPASSYLLRSLFNSSSKFSDSPYYKHVNNDKLLNIVNRYLKLKAEDQYDEYDFKMLNFQHKILLSSGKLSEAIVPLYKVIELGTDIIHAATRLADLISVNDLEEARRLYLLALEKDKLNTNANFGLYSIIVSTANREAITVMNNELIEKSRSNITFYCALLKSLNYKKHPIPNSTFTGMSNLHLGSFAHINFIELLINKKKYTKALKSLNELQNFHHQFSYVTINRIIKISLELYLKISSEESRTSCLFEVKNLITITLRKNPNNPYTYYLLAVYAERQSRHRLAELLFHKSYKLAARIDILREICSFKRRMADLFIATNTGKAIDILREAERFVNNIIEENTSPFVHCYIELARIRLRLARVHFKVSKELSAVTELEMKIEDDLQHCIKFINNQISKASFFLTSAKIGHSVNLSTIYTILGKLHFDSAEREKELNVDQVKSKEKYLKARASFQSALGGKYHNSEILLFLVKIDLILGNEPQIDLLLNEQFFELDFHYKIKLCKSLIDGNYKNVARGFLQQLGQPMTLSEKQQTELAYCYFETKLWRLMSNFLKRKPYLSDRLLIDLANKLDTIPRDTEDALDLRILTADILIKNDKKGINIYLAIIESKYIKGRYEESLSFYNENIINKKRYSFENIEKECMKHRLQLLENQINLAYKYIEDQSRNSHYFLQNKFDEIFGFISRKSEFSLTERKRITKVFSKLVDLLLFHKERIGDVSNWIATTLKNNIWQLKKLKKRATNFNKQYKKIECVDIFFSILNYNGSNKKLMLDSITE